MIRIECFLDFNQKNPIVIESLIDWTTILVVGKRYNNWKFQYRVDLIGNFSTIRFMQQSTYRNSTHGNCNFYRV